MLPNTKQPNKEALKVNKELIEFDQKMSQFSTTLHICSYSKSPTPYHPNSHTEKPIPKTILISKQEQSLPLPDEIDLPISGTLGDRQTDHDLDSDSLSEDVNGVIGASYNENYIKSIDSKACKLHRRDASDDLDSLYKTH